MYGCAGSSLSRRLFSSCGATASHYRGFSCCRAQALGSTASVVAAHGLSHCGWDFISLQEIIRNISVLQSLRLGWALCIHAKSLQSYLTPCDPMDYSPRNSSLHGILQARILEAPNPHKCWKACVCLVAGGKQGQVMRLGAKDTHPAGLSPSFPFSLLYPAWAGFRLQS